MPLVISNLVPPASLPSGGATEDAQDTGNTSLANIEIDEDTSAISLAAIEVSVASIDTNGALASKQDTGNMSLTSIDAKLTSPLITTPDIMSPGFDASSVAPRESVRSAESGRF